MTRIGGRLVGYSINTAATVWAVYTLVGATAGCNTPGRGNLRQLAERVDCLPGRLLVEVSLIWLAAWITGSFIAGWKGGPPDWAVETGAMGAKAIALFGPMLGSIALWHGWGARMVGESMEWGKEGIEMTGFLGGLLIGSIFFLVGIGISDRVEDAAERFLRRPVSGPLSLILTGGGAFVSVFVLFGVLAVAAIGLLVAAAIYAVWVVVGIAVAVSIAAISGN